MSEEKAKPAKAEKPLRDYEEKLMIGQKQMRNALKQLAAQREKVDNEVLNNQYIIIQNQTEVSTTLRELKVHQKQIKSSQERLDTFFTTLETIIANQDRIHAHQKIIVENQMKIMGKIDLIES